MHSVLQSRETNSRALTVLFNSDGSGCKGRLVPWGNGGNSPNDYAKQLAAYCSTVFASIKECCPTTQGLKVYQSRAWFKKKSNFFSLDINECDKPGICLHIPNTECENRLGSFRCKCKQGFQRSANGCQGKHNVIKPISISKLQKGSDWPISPPARTLYAPWMSIFAPHLLYS